MATPINTVGINAGTSQPALLVAQPTTVAPPIPQVSPAITGLRVGSGISSTGGTVAYVGS